MTCCQGMWGPLAQVLESEAGMSPADLLGSYLYFSTNGDSRIIWVSSTVEPLLGWSAEDLDGTVFIDLVHPSDLKVLAPEAAQARNALVEECVSDNDQRQEDVPVVRVRCRSGGYRWMLVTQTPTWLEQSGYVITGLLDIDLVMKKQVRMEEAIHRYEEVIDASITPHVLITVDHSPEAGPGAHVIDRANRAAATYLGTTTDHLRGQSVESLFTFMSREDASMAMAKVEGTRGSASFDIPDGDLEVHVDSVDGSLMVEWRVKSLPWGEVEKLMSSERRFRLLAENISDALVDVDGGVIAWVSPSLKEMVGWNPEDWIGRRYEDFVHPDDLTPTREAWTNTTLGRSTIHRFRMRSKDLAYHWVEAHAKPFVDGHVKPGRFVESFRSVDDVVNAERELDRRATTDPLTGLLNRQELISRLTSIAPHSRRSEADTGVLFCDLDNFKDVNDRWGHLVGDEVLRRVAQTITAQVRGDDFVARVGGDEIMVSLTHIGGLDDALGVADKIRGAVARPIQLDGTEVRVTMSIGVALAHVGEDVDHLIARADQAMYRAKHAGRNRVVTFD